MSTVFQSSLRAGGSFQGLEDGRWDGGIQLRLDKKSKSHCDLVVNRSRRWKLRKIKACRRGLGTLWLRREAPQLVRSGRVADNKHAWSSVPRPFSTPAFIFRTAKPNVNGTRKHYRTSCCASAWPGSKRMILIGIVLYCTNCQGFTTSLFSQLQDCFVFCFRFVHLHRRCVKGLSGTQKGSFVSLAKAARYVDDGNIAATDTKGTYASHKRMSDRQATFAFLRVDER